MKKGKAIMGEKNKEATKLLAERPEHPFCEWHIRECFPLWDIKEIHVRLTATEAQKAEIFRRASPSQISEVENAMNGEIKAIWAHIYEDKSAKLFLPCDVPLTPDESASLVSAVETALGKTFEAALEDEKERHIERLNKIRKQYEMRGRSKAKHHNQER